MVVIRPSSPITIRYSLLPSRSAIALIVNVASVDGELAPIKSKSTAAGEKRLSCSSKTVSKVSGGLSLAHPAGGVHLSQ